MSQNALLGKRISLISMKEIRYEGALYSINEQNSTVALQNVRSYGTEGREQANPELVFVAPSAAVHPYLLFRGCDIKDLHVHDSQPPSAMEPTSSPPAPPVDPRSATPATVAPPPPPPASDLPLPPPPLPPSADSSGTETTKAKSQQQESQAGRGGGAQNRRPKKPNPAHQVGTGASLLNRKARGTVEGGPAMFQEEFDFQSKLEEFEKKDDDDLEDDEAGDEGPVAYAKDDFFDSISCDALDRERGIDNRLRGAQERDLNTETFGAVALNSQRRRRVRGGGGGGGRFGGRGVGREGGREGGRVGGRYDGRGGGREGGRGPGRGRGRGRGGRGRGRQGNLAPEST